MLDWSLKGVRLKLLHLVLELETLLLQVLDFAIAGIERLLLLREFRFEIMILVFEMLVLSSELTLFIFIVLFSLLILL